MAWRFIARRATTRALLDREVPVTLTRQPTWALSAPGTFTGTVPADYLAGGAVDGLPLLIDWGTLIAIEEDGRIRFSGIVTQVSPGDRTTITVQGMSAYPHGEPYTKELRKIKVDPAAMVKEIWAHVQSKTDGNLGVTVTGATSVRIGTDSDNKAAAAKRAYDAATATYKAAQKRRDDLQKTQSARQKETAELRKTVTARRKTETERRQAYYKNKTSANKSAWDSAKSATKAAQANVDAAQKRYETARKNTEAQRKVVETARKTQETRRKAQTEADKKAREDGGAYKLLWWDTPDCGAEIDALAEETPFEYTEEAFIRDGVIVDQVRVHYPRAGTTREDIRFEEGVNVTSMVPATRRDMQNAVVVLGAGEGSKTKRKESSSRNSRLRRTRVIEDKKIKDAARLDAAARRNIAGGAAAIEFESIEVSDHPDTRIGSWSLGDDVLVIADVPSLGLQRIYHRVLGWTLLSPGRAKLTLQRSDRDNYGG